MALTESFSSEAPGLPSSREELEVILVSLEIIACDTRMLATGERYGKDGESGMPEITGRVWKGIITIALGQVPG